jgi:hypothetical protein
LQFTALLLMRLHRSTLHRSLCVKEGRKEEVSLVQ